MKVGFRIMISQLVWVEKKVDWMIQTFDLDFMNQSTLQMNAYMIIEILKFLFGRKIQKSAKNQKSWYFQFLRVSVKISHQNTLKTTIVMPFYMFPLNKYWNMSFLREKKSKIRKNSQNPRFWIFKHFSENFKEEKHENNKKCSFLHILIEQLMNYFHFST